MIINNSYVNIVTFKDVPLAEVFYSKEDSDYFMVIEEIDSEITGCVAYNVVSLTTGRPTYFKDEEEVEIIKGEFRLK